MGGQTVNFVRSGSSCKAAENTSKPCDSGGKTIFAGWGGRQWDTHAISSISMANADRPSMGESAENVRRVKLSM